MRRGSRQGPASEHPSIRWSWSIPLCVWQHLQRPCMASGQEPAGDMAVWAGLAPCGIALAAVDPGGHAALPHALAATAGAYARHLEPGTTATARQRTRTLVHQQCHPPAVLSHAALLLLQPWREGNQAMSAHGDVTLAACTEQCQTAAVLIISRAASWPSSA